MHAVSIHSNGLHTVIDQSAGIAGVDQEKRLQNEGPHTEIFWKLDPFFFII